MKRTRIELLNEVFEKLLVETLKPLRVENLEKMLQSFPKGTAEHLNNMSYSSVETNARKEFKLIIEEKHLKERLDKLDKLYATKKNAYELNMSAFEFEPHDPERVKRAIVYEAKKQEIERLTLIKNNLDQTNNNLEEQNAKILDELNNSREKILETQKHLQDIAPDQA
ncbi:hypothetical protein M9Y10_038403 [Tritrichomonas musculus]|uniref:Uncharacterized protein n=1 Tax=Tritrichomonas musculus TaxID=1915356 RepID=A0ABR2K8B1_9EUKA